MKFSCIIFSVVATILMGCRQNETKFIDTDSLYFDYKVTAEEGKDVACVFQYRLGNADGEAMVIAEPGSVMLDGMSLLPDSAGFSGIYYEKYMSLGNFSGDHEIVFTSPDKKIYKERFRFHTFEIEEMPQEIVRRAFEVKLMNFPKGKKKIRLMLIDTAFSNNDVIDLVYVQDGTLHITDQMLDQLKSGPVSMELYNEEEMPLQNRTKAGGKFFISYGLQRDFDLVDD